MRDIFFSQVWAEMTIIFSYLHDLTELKYSHNLSMSRVSSCRILVSLSVNIIYDLFYNAFIYFICDILDIVMPNGSKTVRLSSIFFLPFLAFMQMKCWTYGATRYMLPVMCPDM